MDRDTDRYRSLTRRTLVLGGLKLGLLGALGARMYYLQVTESARYRVLADENRISVRLLAPSRGQIIDRFGVPLAINSQNFRVVMVPEQAGEVEDTLELLSAIVPLTETELHRVLREVERRRAFAAITVRDNLSWDQVAQIEVNAPELPGLSIEVGELREYPYGTATGHIVGYVGAVSEAELTGDPVLTLPGFKIGKNGIEKHQDQPLRGIAGTLQVEVNAVGRVVRELARDEGTPGRDVQLTIDIGLQEFVQQRLAAEHSAAAVIMDVHNGEIFALASNPCFDPNVFTTGISSDTWRALLEDPYAPLSNKVIAGQYAPGSTFKLMVGLAALEERIITPNHTVYCPGHMDLGDHRFHCWKRGGHGRVDLINGFAQSCDVFFYDVARRVSVDKIAEMANRFGIGHPVGIDLPGERRGLMPNRAWKLGALGVSWQPGETLVVSIGQGYVLATPLQLAVMVARIVNGGKSVRPHLTYRVGDTVWNEAPADLGVSARSLQIVTNGMIAVTSAGNSTARRAQIPVAGLEMGGKTGTSQVRRITMSERERGVIANENLPWRERDHALFVAFAPIQAPRYACAVVVEHGGGGSKVAAPIARDILQECQQRNPARPLLSAAQPGGQPGTQSGAPPGRRAGREG